jgi:dTDP-3-amino-2,3,6-trideoxy-4-keto-D-glucose/dTDP-3-amino-3,4,6-trideoxy-alpha-D-glucose/dTDP-2,6-dideoxy-D-kanosamine transaminase
MKNKNWKVPFAYLKFQFADPDKIFKSARKVVEAGDFTLGKALSVFENNFARKVKVKHAIGVASGTDALYLVLKAKGIKAGDEVITAPNSFVATAASVALTGATPVFVDVRDDYTIDPTLIEKAITKRTKAIIPVHLTGNLADMDPIMELARKYKLFVLEDVAQAAFAKYDGKFTGTIGLAGAFSFHPLKVLNVWGDGGIITTNDDDLAKLLKLWRNHGLVNRNEVDFFAHNSRLDTFQAAVADYTLKQVDKLLEKRRQNAMVYDRLLLELEPNVHVPNRHLSSTKTQPVFTNYVVQVTDREKLIEWLTRKSIRVVIQYPIPIHLQKAAKYLGYKKGDFPVCERQAENIVTLPVHQYLKEKDIRYVCQTIKEFYTSKK